MNHGGEDVARSLSEVDSMTVSVLDAWGFESSLFNSIDQLSANYCHERVEMLFADVLFKHEVLFYQ